MCTVKGKPPDYPENANSLHKNVQLTIEAPNDNGDMEFLHLNTNINSEKKLAVIGVKYRLILA